MSGFLDFFIGSKSKAKPYSQGSLDFLKNVQQNGGGLNQNPLFGAGSDFLQQLLSNSPGAFSAFEAPFLQNFEQNIAPSIANRFSGMGTGGSGLSSSGLQQALAQAGRSLQTDLAGLRSGLQMQALPQALSYAQQPIQNQITASGLIPGQYFGQQGQEGLLQGLLKAFAGGIGRTAAGGF